ncbi:thioredoxin family protein [Candidatus Viadribacter manganicus]|uniref:Thioredoxin family protein n=1 Tax=Candidatus Viadribacter manganicus TaxID=1759059 RepID=A0A1B1AHY9_9PROT|nr:thioredoxin family protein [Candidatus Viadribacter manganicus]ANP46168.1 hypothetical protein ATE48_09675 [Candidatus Viadribacter manganicus]
MMTQAAADPPVRLDRTLYANQGYDPQSNPVADLNAALQRAQREDRRVQIIVDGDLCVWCDILDIYPAENDDVRAEFAQSFLILKVNMSQEDENARFLSRFLESAGYPDFFILASDGSYLSQQNTGALASDRSYHRVEGFEFFCRAA